MGMKLNTSHPTMTAHSSNMFSLKLGFVGALFILGSEAAPKPKPAPQYGDLYMNPNPAPQCGDWYMNPRPAPQYGDWYMNPRPAPQYGDWYMNPNPAPQYGDWYMSGNRGPRECSNGKRYCCRKLSSLGRYCGCICY